MYSFDVCMCVAWLAEAPGTRGNGPRAYREIHGASGDGLGVLRYSAGVEDVSVWAMVGAWSVGK